MDDRSKENEKQTINRAICCIGVIGIFLECSVS